MSIWELSNSINTSKGAFTPDVIRAWNSLHNRHEYASWEGLLPGSSSLLAKCIPVFVQVRRCICSSGFPHTTTITLSSIVVWDFLPPLVMTSLLEQAPDWLTRARISAKVQIFQLARMAHQTFNSRHVIRADFVWGCLAPLVRIPITELSNSNLTSIITIRELYKWIFTSHMSPLWPLYLFLCMHIWVALRKYFHIMT